MFVKNSRDAMGFHMPQKLKYDIKIGRAFGCLTVISCPEYCPTQTIVWAKCYCGKTISIIAANLIKRNSKCTCKGTTFSHGMKGTKIYSVWRSMKERCSSPNSQFFYAYGARGISVCERWQKFENFYEDMGDRPSDSHSIDRINNDGNYEPGNCRWATAKEQARNKKKTKMATYKDVTKPVSEWIEILGLKPAVIYDRLRRGWPTKEAFELAINPSQRLPALDSSSIFK